MAGSSNSPAVQMWRASVRIDGQVVLGPIDLVVERGERWVLLGPNGSGKTTLLSLAGARRQPSSGRVTVLGTRIGREDVRAVHPKVSHTSHVLTELMPSGLSVETVVLTGKRATLSPWFQTFDEGDRRRARLLLEQLGCGGLVQRTFATCSQGERQRVLIARALFAEPELVILDEPASGLDLPSREALIEALETVVSNPVAPTTLVATHHLEEITPSTTHAALLRGGCLVAHGEIDRVLTDRHLEACFGIPLQVSHRLGRWSATAEPPPSSPRSR